MISGRVPGTYSTVRSARKTELTFVSAHKPDAKARQAKKTL
jgi:hypothetical protein